MSNKATLSSPPQSTSSSSLSPAPLMTAQQAKQAQRLCSRIVREVGKAELSQSLPAHVDLRKVLADTASHVEPVDLMLPASSHFQSICADGSILPLAKHIQKLEQLRGETLKYLEEFTDRANVPPHLQWVWDFKLLEPISLPYHAYMKILGCCRDREKNHATSESNLIAMPESSADTAAKSKQADLERAWSLYQDLRSNAAKHWPLDAHTTRTLSYYLASLVLGRRAIAFDGEIAHNLLMGAMMTQNNNLEQFQADLCEAWREKELTHIMLVCARCMPEAKHWGVTADCKALQSVLDTLNKDVVTDCKALQSVLDTGASNTHQALHTVMNSVNKYLNQSNPSETALHTAVDAMQEYKNTQDKTSLDKCMQQLVKTLDMHTQTVVAGTLEYIAHILGVQSVTSDVLPMLRNSTLALFASEFPKMLASDWMPRFALCPALSETYCGAEGSGRQKPPPTWGFESLQLQYNHHTQALTLARSNRESVKIVLAGNEFKTAKRTAYPLVRGSHHALLQLGTAMVSSDFAFMLHHASHIERFMKIKVNTFGADEKPNFGHLNRNLLALLAEQPSQCVVSLQSCMDLILRKCAELTGVTVKKLSSPVVIAGWMVRIHCATVVFFKKKLIYYSPSEQAQGPLKPCEFAPGVLSTSAAVDAHDLREPSLLPRRMLQMPAKTRLADVSGIHIMAMDDSKKEPRTFCSLTRAMLSDHVGRYGIPSTAGSGEINTLLHETIGCIALSESPILHVQQLNQQAQWDQLFEDLRYVCVCFQFFYPFAKNDLVNRYAHVALGKNGSVVFKDRCHFVQCPASGHGHHHHSPQHRMRIPPHKGIKGGVTSHFVRTDRHVYVTTLPLGGSLSSCVQVVSSLQLDRCTLERLAAKWVGAPNKLAVVEKTLQTLSNSCKSTSSLRGRVSKALLQSDSLSLSQLLCLQGEPQLDASVYTDTVKKLAMLVVHSPTDAEGRVDFVLCQL